MVQSAFVRGAQDHAGSLAGLKRFLPTRCTQAPTVTGFQAAKAELRHRRRKIVATGFGKREKRGVMTAQTVWLPTSSRPVSQQPSRKKPVMGFIEQSSSRSPSTLRGVFRRPAPLPLSSLSMAVSEWCRRPTLAVLLNPKSAIELAARCARIWGSGQLVSRGLIIRGQSLIDIRGQSLIDATVGRSA